MNLRRSLAAAAVLLTAGTLTSCGDNFGAQTDQVYNAPIGVNNRSGTVYVLNAVLVSPKNGVATVVASLVNENQTRPDSLKSVSAANPQNQDVTASVSGPTTVPAGGLLNLATLGGVTAKGHQIIAGSFVPLTFTFAHAQGVTVNVPVVPNTNPVFQDVPLP